MAGGGWRWRAARTLGAARRAGVGGPWRPGGRPARAAGASVGPLGAGAAGGGEGAVQVKTAWPPLPTPTLNPPPRPGAGPGRVGRRRTRRGARALGLKNPAVDQVHTSSCPRAFLAGRLFWLLKLRLAKREKHEKTRNAKDNWLHSFGPGPLRRYLARFNTEQSCALWARLHQTHPCSAAAPPRFSAARAGRTVRGTDLQALVPFC